VDSPAILGAPSVVLVRTETQRVKCPYTRVVALLGHVPCTGFAEITAEHHGEKMQIRGFKEPHRCNECGRWFKLVPVVTVVGDKIEGE
jgi:hypothetical protein